MNPAPSLLLPLSNADPGSKPTHSPKGTKPVSPSDRDIVLASGLAVVECSWARLEEVPWTKIKSPNERLREFLSLCLTQPTYSTARKLTFTSSSATVPFLIATNPVNYGKPWRLVSIAAPCRPQSGETDHSLHSQNCVEALAAAFYITGFEKEAELLCASNLAFILSRARATDALFLLRRDRMSKFSWGHSFWKLNESVDLSNNRPLDKSGN